MTQTKETKPKRKRIFYLDALRALAIISVITYHIVLGAKYLVFDQITIPSISWIACALTFNSFRVGVDLFLMLAGALSLGREWTIRTFLGKRLPRIIEPYLFWIAVTMLAYLSAQYIAPDIYQIIPSFTLENIGKFIYSAFRSGGPYYYSYWFFWMILGTYFIMPIFNKWLLHSDLKEAEYFLGFWLITSLFTFTLHKSFPITLTYFVSPIGMAVLGYYLRHTKRKIFNNLYVPIILIIIAVSLQLYFTYILSSPTDMYKFDRYSILMAIEVTGVFLLFRNLDDKKDFFGKIPNMIRDLFKKIVFSIAKYSYGFYLIHLCITILIVRFLKYYHHYSRFSVILLTMPLIVLIVSWIIMALLNRIKYINRVIGAK